MSKRLPSIFIPYVIVIIIYWIVFKLNGVDYSFNDIIMSLLNGSPVVTYSWYIITIVLFYIAFWIFMVICKNKYDRMILLGCVWYILYALFCIKRGYGSWWYNSAHLLIIGMFWATYEREITDIIKRCFIVVPIVWGILILSLLLQYRIAFLLSSTKINVLMHIITSALFGISVILFSMKYYCGNKILKFIGNISLEVYLVQGLFISVQYISDRFHVQNEFAWSLIVLFGSITAGYALHKIFHLLISKYKIIFHDLLLRVQ